MKISRKLLIIFVLSLILVMAASVQPQLSKDEQDAIVEAVVQTMNPENMKKTVIAEVEADLIDKFTAAGYIGVAAALMSPGTEAEPVLPTATPVPTSTPTPVPTSTSTTMPEFTSTPEMLVVSKDQGSDPKPTRLIETSVVDYWDGAVLQEDGTYRGLHAKMTSSYAYTIGEDENGVVRQFHTEYTPNTRFNLDVVFENDGSLVWPPRMEMRHVGNVGEYTGHAESVFIDRSDNPVKPGDRAAFTVSAYGSENLGWTTFYFQLYDADSGNPIEGGQGSFTYHAI